MPEQGPNRTRARRLFLSRRAFLRWAGMSAVGAVLTGCGRPYSTDDKTRVATDTPSPAPASRRGGTLVVGMAATSLATLDPAAYSDRATETVVRNVFDGLVTRTIDNRVVPEIAQSYRWLDDRTVEFVLKRGVRFHNGEELTADDVVFTFNRVLHQDVGAPRRGFAGEVKSVQGLDDYTVRFHLRGPWPVFFQMLVHNQIVPKSYLVRVGDESFASEPVGCGPFRYVGGDLSREVLLERFDGYYGGADALPPIGPSPLDRAVFRMIPDVSERLGSLSAGEVHIIQNVPPYLVPQLVGRPDLKIKATVGTQPKFMDLNVRTEPFDDVRVRRAINYAVDVSSVLKAVAGGYGAVLAGPLSPANRFVDPDLAPYGYDPEKALALLSEAGYRPGDVSFVIDAYGPYVDIAEAVASQLRALGMDVSVSVGDYNALKPRLLDCERQAFLRDWGDSAFDPVGYLEAKWQTRSEGTSAGRGNYACYSNPRVDELIELGASEPDTENRREAYYEAQRLIYEDAPAVFLYVPQEIMASSIRVHNWEPSPDGRINLHDVWLSDG